MKKIIVFSFAFFSFCVLNAQVDLTGFYNYPHSGRGFTLVLSKTFNNKNEFGVGLRYNQNKIAYNDDQNNVFFKRLYASNFGQHWGGEFFYQRYIIDKWQCLKPFLFYDLQITYSTTRNRDLLPYTYDINGDVLYKEYTEHFGPFTWFEQCIGIGFKAQIHKQFYLIQKIGAGTTFILGKDEKLWSSYDKFNWEFAGLIQAGLVYRFKE